MNIVHSWGGVSAYHRFPLLAAVSPNIGGIGSVATPTQIIVNVTSLAPPYTSNKDYSQSFL